MVCARCGTVNDADCRFCTACGAGLAAVCPSCGAATKPGSRFCGSCGTALATDPAPPTPADAHPGGGAQRRMVTVLFADLVGFTTISQHRDAEDVRDLLTRYFDVARNAVERHGGVVEKFIGDAVMAVWGSEVAHEDDAERAVRAALEVVDAVRALGASVRLDLAARAGVLTGEAAVTVGATGQGMVAGDIVNTASRLQTAADPGTVLVGERTYQAASDAIAFEPRGDTTVKGRDEPVATWRALRIVGERGGSGRPGRPEPPFVGRDEEVRLVKDLLHVTARERRARLVSITGIGGIGKSRLMWEFRKYIDGLSDDVFWHQGRCPAYGEGVSFWALGEMVRMRAGISDTDNNDDAREKLAAMAAEHLRDDQERRWVEPRLAHLLGLDDAPAGSREELFSAWRTLFERIAGRGVTTMVFEDLHWADAGLLDFIESIPEWSRSSAIVVVTLARPELLDRRPTWGAGQRNYTALHLEPLAEDAMLELVRGFVTGLADADARRISARAEGVPLYAVETIRMLAGSGVLTIDGNCYDTVGDIGALDVPGSLHALIAARLDVLAAPDRELLRDAAVLGTSFTLESLVSISGQEAEEIETRLRALVRREFLTQDLDPRSPERGQYTFLQGLIREVAYGTLSKADRRTKHLAVAGRYASLGDELVGVVASHYVEALRATPEGPEADELAVKARDYVTAAAQRALSLGSPEQALVYVEQMLELTPDGKHPGLLALAGEAAHRSGRAAEAMSYFDAAADIARAAGDHIAVARIAARAVMPLGILDRRSEALRRLEEARDQLPPETDDRTRAELLTKLALVQNQVGASEQATATLEVALAAAEHCAALDVVAEAFTERSSALFALGRYREGLVMAQAALDLANEAGSNEMRALALLHLGVQLAADRPMEALECSQEAASLARRAGIRGVEQIATANAVEAAIDAGGWDQARQMIDDLLPRSGDAFMRAGLVYGAATLAAYAGDTAGAERHLAEVAPRAEIEDRMVPEHTWHLRASSLVRLLSGDVAGAYEEGMQSIALDPTGMNAGTSLAGCVHAAAWLGDLEKMRAAADGLKLLAGSWTLRQRHAAEAAVAALDGRHHEAATGFRRVLDEHWELGARLDHAWCALDALAVLPRDLVPDQHVERARATATELEAIPLLERLAALA